MTNTNIKDLNAEQKEAIRHENGPLLIIAGAGTGKTTVITERIRYLIAEKGVKPEEILALTFTEKASKEMENRIDSMMPYGYTEMWISTFHSFCDRILKEEGLQSGINPNYRLMSESDSILFLKKNLFALNLDYFRPLGNPTKFLEALLTHFSRLEDEDITPQEYISYANSLSRELEKTNITEERIEEIKKIKELAYCYKTYSELKIKESLMDFSDLIAQTLSLLRSRKHILKKYQDQFKFILVDEFQDTNFAQNELAILLAGKRKNVTVVADDDQAIYRWRGAALSNVMQFKNNFPGAKMVTLTKNYRSTQEILDRSYMLIQNNNPNRLEALENIDKKLISERGEKGEATEFINPQRVDEEAEEIAKKIKALTVERKYVYSDIAILVRANNHAQPITQALARFKIPYQFLGPGHLFQQEEIKDLIAYLKVLYNLEDTVSLFRTLQMDIFGLSMRDISSLLTYSRKNNISLFETMEKANELTIPDTAKEKIRTIKDMILRHLERIKKDTAGQILYYFLADTGLFSQYLAYTTEKGEQTAQNVAKFFDKIKTFETLNREATLYSAVDWIDLMMEMGESPLISEIDYKELNAVNILTIHSSKGLEFPVVFMINLVIDRFPTRERHEKIPFPQNLIKEIIPEGDYHLQEERRLFYVGMTRAKDLLFFTAACFYAEGKREKKISPFVYEALPEEKESQGKVKRKPTQLSLETITRDYQEELKEEEKSKETLRITSLSFSSLQAFDICPLHYRARYILNLPPPFSAPLSFGISLHNTLKDFYDLHMQKNTPSEKDLLEILRKEWISGGYSEKSYERKMFENGERILIHYYNNPNLFEREKTTLATEMPFSFYLNEKIRITGKIDRIDKLKGNEIEIIDYKTGKASSLSKSSYAMQLGIYALAATRVENRFLKRKIDEITVSLIYLDTGEKISLKITEEDMVNIDQKIKEKIKEIESTDFKCSKSILCGSCEYKMLCNVKI